MPAESWPWHLACALKGEDQLLGFLALPWFNMYVPPWRTRDCARFAVG